MRDLLLHICCGPCSVYCIDDIRANTDFNITGFFANPNIHPYDEFMRRKGSAEKACEIKKVPLVISGNYNIAAWKSFENSCAERCEMCYTVRAMLTAEKAAELGFKYFSSTLFVSPYQKHDVMREVFYKAGEKYGVEFYYRDFRDGFYSGQQQAREIGLYRQKYCGCIKSLYGE